MWTVWICRWRMNVSDVIIPTQVIKYNQNFLKVDQPIRLQYSNQSNLLDIGCQYILLSCDIKVKF
jgi:hypothetical protein